MQFYAQRGPPSMQLQRLRNHLVRHSLWNRDIPKLESKVFTEQLGARQLMDLIEPRGGGYPLRRAEGAAPGRLGWEPRTSMLWSMRSCWLPAAVVGPSSKSPSQSVRVTGPPPSQVEPSPHDARRMRRAEARATVTTRQPIRTAASKGKLEGVPSSSPRRASTW